MERYSSPGLHLAMQSDLSLRERCGTCAAAACVSRITIPQFLMSMALRRPSESRLKQIETAKIIAPGRAATQGLT